MPVGHPRKNRWSRQPVVLVVWCGQCTKAHHKNPGRLGHLEISKTPRFGELNWIYAQETRSKAAWGKIRRVPAFLYVKRDKAMPDVLPASCPRHGVGTISTVDVIASRGSVVLDLNTARA